MLEDPSNWLRIMHSSEFMPHGHCYLWKPDLLLLHVVSDLLIGMAYYSIPISLLYVIRKRGDLPYPWVLGLFSAFILACGTTHLLAVWTAWNPAYWLSGGMKAITAVFSIITAIALVPLMPKIMAMRSPRELEEINASLVAEIERRELVEQDLQLANKQAYEASQAKTDFLARISHELRTPLNGIIGMSNLLLDSELNSKQRDYLEIITGSGDTLLALINDLLDLSKLESGEFKIHSGSFSMAQLIDHVVSAMSLQAKARDLELVTELDPDMPLWLSGDKQRVAQILVNLVQNAIKFTPAGQVVISASSVDLDNDHCQLRVEVRDTGIGIAPEHQIGLFDAFVQNEAEPTGNPEGTGLGLAICKQLVQRMNGEIGVESEEGKGSTFWFTLRTSIGEPVTARAPKIRKDTQPYAGVQALVVEDNLVNQTVAVATLETLGIKCEVANNGMEALSCLEKNSYDLVMMDCRMPIMDGYEATRAIRTSDNARIRNTIIIALTANAISGDDERCLEAGMNDYLAKPLEFAALRATLARWLGKDTAEG